LRYLYVDLKKWCCFASYIQKCAYYKAIAGSVSSCEDLIGSNLLKWILWNEAAFIIGSNVLVILFWVYKSKTSTQSGSQALYLCSLALSDMMIGIYLIIIGTSNVIFEGKYYAFKHLWKKGIFCNTASSLTILSAIMSVTTLFALSVEQYNTFKNPLSYTKMPIRKLFHIFCVLWILISTSVIGLNFGFEPHKDDTCFLVDFSSAENKLNFAMYVVLVILLLVVVLLVWILINNILTLFLIVQSRKMIGRKSSSKEKSVILRTILVSLSNFIGWSVVVPVVCLSLSGYNLESLVFAWVAIIGLPINSLLNPTLYTFSTYAFKEFVLKQLK